MVAAVVATPNALHFHVDGNALQLLRDFDLSRHQIFLIRPRITILSASSDNGRCNSFASSHGARFQTSRSSSVVGITGRLSGRDGQSVCANFIVETGHLPS
jgi:hypothetical protein